MTALEEKIWAATFVAEYMKREEFIISYNLQGNAGNIGQVSGFLCAKKADEVIEKFREALLHKDAESLLIVQEK